MTAEERADILVKAWNSTQPFSARLNKKAIASLIATMSAGINAAHIEGLLYGMRQAITALDEYGDIKRAREEIYKDIFALERGKGEV